MFQRLAEQGLRRHARSQRVALTEAGEWIARAVVRYHRLLERYLVEARESGPARKQPVTWSLTMPTLCMKA